MTAHSRPVPAATPRTITTTRPARGADFHRGIAVNNVHECRASRETETESNAHAVAGNSSNATAQVDTNGSGIPASFPDKSPHTIPPRYEHGAETNAAPPATCTTCSKPIVDGPRAITYHPAPHDEHLSCFIARTRPGRGQSVAGGCP